MKSIKKDIFVKLEQLYYSSNQDFTKPQYPGGIQDVPDISDEKEYKTQIEIPPATTDSMREDDNNIDEPEIKTKKGKTILREPPSPESHPEDVELVDKKGNEVELKSLDSTELEEMISIFEDSLYEQETKKSEEDNSEMDMGEQNTETGEDPNIDPNQIQPDPNAMMGGDYPSSTGAGMDMSGGMGMGAEPPKTAEEVGRIFELKKIYSRLLAIESQLSFSPDIILLKLRKFISQSIELFETLISNINAFKNEVDDIIILYYHFLEQVYDIMKRFYKIKQREEIEQNKNK
jgi:hypothetical protein